MFRTSAQRLASCALAALLAAAGPVSAQSTPSVTVTARAVIPEILTLDVEGTDVEFPVPTSVEMDQGFVEAGTATSLTPHGNVPFAVLIQGETATLLREDGTPTTKPISDLEWSADQGETWTPVSTDRQTLPSEVADIEYRLMIHMDRDEPGRVMAQITYHVVPR